jgi:hypothetical protein
MSESKKCHLFCGGGVILQNGRGSSICIDLDDWEPLWSSFLTYFISFPKRQKLASTQNFQQNQLLASTSTLTPAFTSRGSQVFTKKYPPATSYVTY